MHQQPGSAALRAAQRSARDAPAPLLLAVSGGLDSMALLSAMAQAAPGRIAAVATFDHGTGPSATAAAALVCRTAASLGLAVVQGHIADGHSARATEASWRAARHRFLADAAASLDATVVTAHSRDDQIETVLFRVMRGSGPRGLAALYAASPIVRPFIELDRREIERFARATGLVWIDDPGNASRAHARNRIRLEILPALRRVDPMIDATLVDLSRRAAALRCEVDSQVEQLGARVDAGGRLIVDASELAGFDSGSLGMLWGALASRAGLTLDHRGTRRIVAFTAGQSRQGTVPLSGGWCLEATRDRYILQRTLRLGVAEAALPEEGSLDWGRFRFTVSKTAAASAWTASIAAPAGAVIRSWNAGDRLSPASGQPRRRVTRYLSDVGVQGRERAEWPVVVAGDDVVWIPGVRRSDAATDRSGRPVRHYVCERIDR